MAKYLVFLVAAYSVCYAMYRHYSTVEHDGAPYMQYGLETPAFYYAFFPVALLDGMTTGRKAQYGPFES